MLKKKRIKTTTKRGVGGSCVENASFTAKAAAWVAELEEDHSPLGQTRTGYTGHTVLPSSQRTLDPVEKGVDDIRLHNMIPLNQ